MDLEQLSYGQDSGILADIYSTFRDSASLQHNSPFRWENKKWDFIITSNQGFVYAFSKADDGHCTVRRTPFLDPVACGKSIAAQIKNPSIVAEGMHKKLMGVALRNKANWIADAKKAGIGFGSEISMKNVIPCSSRQELSEALRSNTPGSLVVYGPVGFMHHEEPHSRWTAHCGRQLLDVIATKWSAEDDFQVDVVLERLATSRAAMSNRFPENYGSNSKGHHR